MAEGLPALGIVAAVLGVVKAMGALDQEPEYLGAIDRRGAGRNIRRHLLLLLRGVADRHQDEARPRQALRLYIIVKQTLLAFMNGAMPQVAVEHGRKTISAYERPTIDEVEQETLGGGHRKRRKEHDEAMHRRRRIWTAYPDRRSR